MDSDEFGPMTSAEEIVTTGEKEFFSNIIPVIGRPTA
jgi:hypothetical protein